MQKAKKITLMYIPVAIVVVFGLITGQSATVTGRGEMFYGIFVGFGLIVSSFVACFLQARLRTKWMWSAPFITALLAVLLTLQRTHLDYLGMIVFVVIPSILGLLLGLVIPSKKIISAYIPVLFVVVFGLITGQTAIVTGGELGYTILVGFGLVISSMITGFLQARLRTKWMWLAPVIIALLALLLMLLPLMAHSDYLGMILLVVIPSILGLLLGLVIPSKKEGKNSSSTQ